MRQTIRVLLADAETGSRLGYELMLARAGDLELAGRAADAQEVLRQARDLAPHVVLLDLRLPGSPPPILAAELRQACPGTGVLALAGTGDGGWLWAMLAAGVASYALKDEPEQALVAAIRAVGMGRAWVSRRLAAGVAAWPAVPGPQLTRREREVLDLLAMGNSNEQVGAALQVRQPTVRFHLTNLYRKLGVQGRGGLVSWAVRHGFGGNGHGAGPTLAPHPIETDR